MEELKQSREETAKARQELGAEDVRPGEVEGMTDESGWTRKSKAMEKRKRELEERRQMLEAKRRKTKPPSGDVTVTSVLSTSIQEAGSHTPTGSTTAKPTATDPFGTLEAQSKTTPSPLQTTADPFAVLEGAAQSPEKSKGRVKMANPAATETDSFLAELEQEFLGSRIKKKT